MPGQLNAIDFNGNTIQATLATVKLTLPKFVWIQKIDDHTIQATFSLQPFLPKWVPSVIGALLGTRQVTWDIDTGSINVR